MEHLKQRAWIGDQFVKNEIKGVIVDFHGLNYSRLKNVPDIDELELSFYGGLCVTPYYGPWSWMNRESREFVDKLISDIYCEYGLDNDVPLLIKGGSMGGLSALIYARYTHHPIKACYVNCPVTDLPYHFGEREDLPRTLYHAFAHYEEPFERLLEEHSPLHQVEHFPDIPYLILHGDKDSAVNKEKHSDRLVKEMVKRKHAVEYIEVPGMENCQISDYIAYRKTIDFLKLHLQ